MVTVTKHHFQILIVAGSLIVSALVSGQRLAFVAAEQREAIEPRVSQQDGLIDFIEWQPGGLMIAAGSLSNVWLYSDELVEIEHFVPPDGDQFASLAWSPDGTRLAILSGNDVNRSWNLQIWNINTSAVDLALDEYDISLYYLKVLWSPDGTRLSISADQEVQLRDSSSGALLMTLSDFDVEVTGIEWSHDGSSLATTSARQLQIWDATSGDKLSTYAGNQVFQFVAWSPDDTMLATTSGDLRDIQIWDASTLQPISFLMGHSTAILDLAWSPSGLASVISDTITIWDVDSQRVAGVLEAGAPVFSIAWSPDGTRIAYGGEGGTVHIWDVHLPVSQLTIPGHTEIDALAWSPDGERIATGHQDGTVQIWDSHSRRLLLALQGYTGEIDALAWKPDGRQLLSGGYGTSALVWDTRSGQLLATLPDISPSIVICATWSLDGSQIMTFGFDAGSTSFKVWNATTFQLVSTGVGGDVTQLAWSPDHSRIAMANAAGQLLVADATTTEIDLFLDEPKTPEGGVYGVYAAAWSPDGQRVAGGNWAGTVRVWDAITGQNLLNLQATDNPTTDWTTTAVHALHFSADGNQLSSITSDGTLRTWEVETGAIISTEQLAGTPLYAAAWSPDGTRIAYGGADGTLEIIDTP
jgi:WD40 repeat protein